MDESGHPEMGVLSVRPDLARKVQEELGQNVFLCYQCVKCTNGCPLSEYLDWKPNQVMRALQLGQESIALDARSPWLCSSCQTCATRCPQSLDIPMIMDYLTREALESGRKAPVPEVDIFDEAFLREVRLWGRAYELGMMAEVKLRTGNLSGDLDLAMKMLQKRKLPLVPKLARRPRNVKTVPGAAQAVAYYPGCSLEATSREFNESTLAVCRALGLRLVEPKNWLCCGSSAAHRANPDLALKLPASNLALIEQSGFTEVTMPCAACFNRHKTAQFEMRLHAERKDAMEAELGYEYRDAVEVRSLSQTLLAHVGADGVEQRVVQALKGLRVVPYYGCLLTRPPQVTGARHPENPTDLDELLGALGAEVVDWSYKTSCCGAAHSITRPDIVLKTSAGLIEKAREAGAEVIAVACPLCHSNLDARQLQMELAEPMPVLFFTQLMAVALGLPEDKAALGRNMVDPMPLLRHKGFIN